MIKLNSFQSPRYGSFTFPGTWPFFAGKERSRLFSTDQHCERIRLPEIIRSKCEARALTCLTTEIPNQTHILVLSKQDLSTLTRVHGARFQQGTWWLLVLRHQTRSLKTAAWSSQEGIDICSTLWRMCMNGKHHAFWITNGFRRWSNRLLQSDYAEGESFYPSCSQKPWRNCNVHSTASLQVQHASVMAATPNQQLFLFENWRWRRRRNVFCPIFWNKVNFTFASFENLSAIMHVKSKRSFNLLKLFLFDFDIVFFFFNFQPKATRAGDEKKSTWPYQANPHVH